MVSETRNKQIKAAMRVAQVPTNIDYQAFTDEPYMSHVRELFGILESHTVGDTIVGVNIYPDNVKHSYEAKTLFYLVAKRAVMTHKSVNCIEPTDILEARERNEIDQLYKSVMFISHYALDTHQLPNQFTNAEKVTIKWFINNCIDRKSQVFLLSDISILESGKSFWGNGFSTNLQKRIIDYKMVI